MKTDIELNALKLEKLCHSSTFKMICQSINNAAGKILQRIKYKSVRNLIEDEWKALKELKMNKDLAICKADKRKCLRYS